MKYTGVGNFLQYNGPSTIKEIAWGCRGVNPDLVKQIVLSDVKTGGLREYKVGREKLYGLVTKENLGKKDKLYGTILADPPWNYRDQTCRGGARKHYRTMTLEDIVNLPVKQRVLPDAQLFLWVTVPMTLDGAFLDVIPAWGFRPITMIPWLKVKGVNKERKIQIGTGRWFRGTWELCIFAVRGKPTIPESLRKPNVYMDERVRRHSRKPADFRKWISDISPEPRLELFAETSDEGWDSWGKKRRP